MNKYLILFICFISSLFIVTYEDDRDIRESINYQESVNVFNDMSDYTKVVNNPEMNDINIYVYFVTLFYSLLFIIITIKSMRKSNRYVNVMKI